MRTSSWSAAGSPAWLPPTSWPAPDRSVLLLDRRTARLARRPGVLVARRAVLRQLPRAAAAADPGLGGAGPGRLAGQRRVRPAGGLLAAPLGRGVRAVRGRRAAGAGCTSSGCAGSRWCSGPSAAATPLPATATRSPASTSPGAPVRGWSSRSRERVLQSPEGADPGAAPGDRDRGGRRRRARVSGDGAGAQRAAPRRTLPRTRSSGSSPCPRRRWWWPAAASAATSTWSGRTGRPAGATRRAI